MSRIVVLKGGNSPEREISFKTAAAVEKALKELGHDVATFDPKDEPVTKLIDFKPDFAFIAMHGKGGEDGSVQGLLEVLHIPYTGSGLFASVLCLNKLQTKQILSHSGILMPKHWVFLKGENQANLINELPYPVITKPNDDGSTIGMTIVKNAAEMNTALQTAFVYGETVLVEQFIVGKELTVGVLNGKALAIVEIAPKSGFYDYESKYTPGKTDYFCPARLDDAVTTEILKRSEEIVKVLGCRGAPRVDYMLGADNKAYFLEVNTIPGMTETSLLPKAAASRGIDFKTLCAEILKGARLDR